MREPRCVALIASILLLSGAVAGAEPGWVRAMREVHSRSQGETGVLVHLGDSITYSMAYFAPLEFAADAKMSPPAREALHLVNSHMKRECYRWKGVDKGNYSGQTAAWGLENSGEWISTLKPEVALILFGTNDIRRGTISDHERNLRALIRKCLDRGVVVILSTIPPMHGFDEKVRRTVEAQRQVAADMNVPLIDFYAHVLNRRPDDWDGTRPEFESFDQWQVPTIISKDGVHPSNPDAWRKDYTEEGLARSGNVLRSYLSLMAYAEVVRVVLRGETPGPASTMILGPQPPAPANLPEVDASSAAPHREAGPIEPPAEDWFPKAPPLPPPAGEVIAVATVDELYAAATRVKSGGTILVADGLYRMPQTFSIRTGGVTLRGRSGDRTKTVLDFSDCRHHEGVAISDASDVTIADLTVQNVRQNGIKINSNHAVDRVRIYNVISHNVWQRHIKGPLVPDRDGRPDFVERCRVEYCLFYNDRPKRRGDEPWEDSNPRMGFNYIGGIDVMCAKDWVISDNVFTGIHGRTGEARGAIFMWHNSTDCVIERNIFIDCDSGICMGNSSARGERRHASRFIVRNNFVVRCPENNILADHTRDCKVLNNTVHDPDSHSGRLLRVVHANDGLVVEGNIFSGPRIVIEQVEGPIDVKNNLVRSVGDYFVDPARGNLRLTARAVDAIDRATARAEVTDDIDGEKRGEKPDLGADEFRAE